MAVITGQRAYDEGYILGAYPDLIQPASIDVRLGPEFLNPRTDLDPIDPSCQEPLIQSSYIRPGTFFTIEPEMLVLASTVERVHLPPDVVATFEGKSSLGRLGLGTHVTAGFIDPGFKGEITIELHNVAPYTILLWPGMKIGQICFMRMEEPAIPYGEYYGSTYQNQSGPQPYRISSSFIKEHPDA